MTHAETSWHCVVVGLSVLVLALHARTCLETDPPAPSDPGTPHMDTFDHGIVHKLHLAVHLLRVQVPVPRLRVHLCGHVGG